MKTTEDLAGSSKLLLSLTNLNENILAQAEANTNLVRSFKKLSKKLQHFHDMKQFLIFSFETSTSHYSESKPISLKLTHAWPSCFQQQLFAFISSDGANAGVTPLNSFWLELCFRRFASRVPRIRRLLMFADFSFHFSVRFVLTLAKMFIRRQS